MAKKPAKKEQALQHSHHHHEHNDCCHEHEHEDAFCFDDFDDMDMGAEDTTLVSMTSILVDSIGHLTELCVETELDSGKKLSTKDVLSIYDQVSEKVFANMQKLH